MNYTITLDNGDNFTGLAEECARWYCKHERIYLQVEPYQNYEDFLNIDSFNAPAELYALFTEDNPEKEYTFIAAFEDINDKPIEKFSVRTIYHLFFTEYLCDDVEDASWTITPHGVMKND